MSTNETEVVRGIRSDYAFGWSDTEDYFFKSARGLSHELIDAISDHKSEPDWMRAFRHKSLVEWETGVIAPIIEDLIDTFAARGRAELVREFTFQFPVQIIAELLGVPGEDHEKFHDMAVWIVNISANPEKGFAASAALRQRSTPYRFPL